jgi:hypothetical protein
MGGKQLNVSKMWLCLCKKVSRTSDMRSIIAGMMHGMKREYVIQQFLLFITGQEGIVEKLHQGFFSDT